MLLTDTVKSISNSRINMKVTFVTLKTLPSQH